MALQFHDTAHNARLDAIETVLGPAPLLTLCSGPPPANCQAPNAGTVLVVMALPSDWMAAAALGAKTINGPWSGVATADGIAAHFRIHDSTGTECGIQGTVGEGSGDMQIDNTEIIAGQSLNVPVFTIRD